MSIQPFTFGGNTGRSYEDLKRRRAYLDAAKARNTRQTPQTAAGGLAAIGKAISHRVQEKRLNTQNDEMLSGARQAGQMFQNMLFGPPPKPGEPWQMPKPNPQLYEMANNQGLPPQMRQFAMQTLQGQMKAHRPQTEQERLATEQARLANEGQRLQNTQYQNQINNPKRHIIEGADGYKYYGDDGARVLPNVTQPEKLGYRILSPQEAQARSGLYGGLRVIPGP